MLVRYFFQPDQGRSQAVVFRQNCSNDVEVQGQEAYFDCTDRGE